ncbi:tryptophan synthase beta chain like [Acetivibrio straminisolvens JCM 21531]|uniref:Tryptophan synthase beta chain like n=1 Tax=Acetivibrio straminisolvens JCM 21531 TaxID=1294263 RepID=W4VC46_9FIRM|nr:tryptophan synthase beta chain like [Acetivibrio straminisolvens JCM 21531]
MSKKDVNKVVLDEADIPKQWYNILADMPNKPAPYFSSNTGKPATVEELQAIFPLD